MEVTAISWAGHSKSAKDRRRNRPSRCLTAREPDFGGSFNTVLKIIMSILDIFLCGHCKFRRELSSYITSNRIILAYLLVGIFFKGERAYTGIKNFLLKLKEKIESI